LTTTAAHGMVVGDIFNLSLAPPDPLFDGGPFTVNGVPSTTTFTYHDTATVTLTVTKKQLAGGTTATLTTSVANHLSVGDTVAVSGVDPRFNGTYSVTAAGGSTLTYTVAPVVSNVTNAAVSSGLATLTTFGAHNLSVGDTVTVSTGDSRYDGTVVVKAPVTA